MPSPHADGTTAAIRQAVSIVDLIVESGVALTRRGRTFKGRCPFHDDHNPSFDVDPDRQRYRCWSCGAHGDIFDFVMNQERVDFREALRVLAQRARIDLPAERHRRVEDSTKKELQEISRWAEDEFHRCFLESELAAPAREYVEKRGLTEESARAFRIGFAPNDWEWLITRARSRRLTPESLERCGLAMRRPRGPGFYDRFRGRLMFPIRDARGHTIAFGGRILPPFEASGSAKYVNSAESAIFIKRDHLYGLDRARDAVTKSRVAVVVEGYTDCIMAHQHGLTHVVGTLGTAMGESHVAVLKRYADRIILVYDGDDAGQKAADRALGLILIQEIDLRVLSLPDKLDPCEILIERGADEFRRGLDSAEDALDFKLRRAGQVFDLTSLAGRRQALDFVLGAIAVLPLVTTGPASVTRDVVLDKLGMRLGVTPDVVRRRLRELREQQLRRQTPRDSANGSAPPEEDLWKNESAVERELLEILLAEPARIDQITLSEEDFQTPGYRKIFAECLAVHRDEGKLDVDSLRLRLENRELACRASILAETGREKGAVDRRLHDVLAYYANRRADADEREAAIRGDRPENNPKDFLAHKVQRALSRQRRAQRHAMSDSPTIEEDAWKKSKMG